MQNSGTQLVLALLGMALLLGVTSWWYRYETARQASQFWGPEASRLIAESEGLEAVEQVSRDQQIRTDLSKARGQAHLRHAFMSDRNIVWDKPLEDKVIHWQWQLRFHEAGREAWVLLSDDLKAIGKRAAPAGAVLSFSCEPMTTSLAAYFQAVGLLDKSSL